MSPRVRSTTILVVAAVVATWFVARPAHGAARRGLERAA